ncbi:hypothetical protein [Streptomyces sp. CL7]|uniref:hypothetical protein n=1 Tax=Streptomyces sp. CL7 TaxID=3096006 RepID=UPI002A75718A|nr:hypothetical protein [Streptomyces sp. CL7]WPP34284.1 hypothetical protein SJH97_33585 [Streptomyces sp. CL7]
MAEVLAYVAAGMVLLWGVSHAIPTRGVVAGYGELTVDNRRILIQEWLAEAVTMFSLATLVIVVTAVDAGATATEWAYRVVAGALVVLAVLTALTGARTSIVWFKICPVLLSASAILLLVASLV